MRRDYREGDWIVVKSAITHKEYLMKADQDGQFTAWQIRHAVLSDFKKLKVYEGGYGRNFDQEKDGDPFVGSKMSIRTGEFDLPSLDVMNGNLSDPSYFEMELIERGDALCVKVPYQNPIAIEGRAPRLNEFTGKNEITHAISFLSDLIQLTKEGANSSDKRHASKCRKLLRKMYIIN